MSSRCILSTRGLWGCVSRVPQLLRTPNQQLVGSTGIARFQPFASKSQSRRNKVVKRTQSVSDAFGKKRPTESKPSKTQNDHEDDIDENVKEVLTGEGNSREGDELESTMNKLVQQSPPSSELAGRDENNDSISGQSTALSEPTLERLENDPTQLPRSLPEPPEDFEWLWIPHIRTGVLCPNGWNSAHGKGEWIGLSTYKAVITVDDPESCKIGLTIRSYEGVFSQPLVKNETPMQLAEFFTSLHMKKTGPPESDDSEVLPELVDSWQFTPMEGLDTYGMEYVMNYSEFDDTATRRGFQYHLHLIFNRHEDVAYEITFRAPYVFWQQAWNTHGKHMIDNLHLNWDDKSPLRFQ